MSKQFTINQKLNNMKQDDTGSLPQLTGEQMAGMPATALTEYRRICEDERNAALGAEFSTAFAALQGEIPTIKREREAHGYSYAGLDDIMRVLRPLLSKHGFGVSFSTEQTEGALKVKCLVAFRNGRTMASELVVPVDEKLRANDSQRMGSANSYGRRYALCNALNIAVSDEDDDGAAGGTQVISEEEAEEVRGLLRESGADEAKFLKWVGAEGIEGIEKKKLGSVRKQLQRKAKEVAK